MQIYEASKLKNGLRVVTTKMSGRESIAVAVWFKVGGRYEKLEISGISHFIEHMLFKGTTKRSARKIKEDIEGRGGLLNGFTSEDTTCYLIKIVKKHMPLAIATLADMVENSKFALQDIERERTVILEEIRMYMDMPMHFAHDLINQLLWQKHPLGMFVAGDFKSVASINQNEIKKFHSKFYVPNNALVTVCGNIEHDEVVELVKKNFRYKSQKNALNFKRYKSTQTAPRYLFKNKETAQAHLVIGFPALSRKDSARYALALLHIIMGANMSSRLYEQVREKRGLAYEIRSGLSYYEDTGDFTISAGVENKKLEKALLLIVNELKKVKDKGIKPSELKRAKEYMLNQLMFALDDTLDHMLWVGEKSLHSAKLPSKDKICELISKTSVEEVNRVAIKIFNKNRLNLVVIGSVDKTRQNIIKKNIIKF